MIERSEAFLNGAITYAFIMFTLAFLLIIIRIVKGPTLPDRVIGLDMLVAAGMGFIVAFAIKTQFMLYLDVAIALGLVGFLATVAFARFVIRRDRPDADTVSEPDLKAEAMPSKQGK